MTNVELISELFSMFREYFVYFFPVFGVLAGVHLVLNWLWSICFRPFDH